MTQTFEHDVFDSVCKECGMIIGDKDIHSSWHGKIDSLLIMQMRF